MFVENQNYADSLLFLGSARIALANIVKESAVKNKKQLVNYLHKEASDYEIMHLLVREGMPDDKFNPSDEAELWLEFKIRLLANRETVQEVVGHELFANVLTEVDSIYPLQSGESLFEYSMELFKEDLVQEGPLDTLWNLVKGGGQAKDVAPLVSKTKSILQRGVTADDAAKAFKVSKELAKQGQDKLAASLKKAAQQAGAAVGKVGAGVKAGAKAAQQKMTAKDLEIKRAAQSQSRRAAGETIAKAQQTGFDKGLKGDIAAKGAGERARAATQKMQQAGQQMDKGLKTGATGAARASDPQQATGLMAKLRGALDSAKELPAKISKFAQSPAGLAVGGAALAALAIYGATKAYKRFFSKAAKACAGMSGADKSRCMNQYKVKGLQAQINDLKAGASACKAAKNPDKCQGAITRKMAGLQKKIGALQARGA